MGLHPCDDKSHFYSTRLGLHPCDDKSHFHSTRLDLHPWDDKSHFYSTRLGLHPWDDKSHFHSTRLCLHPCDDNHLIYLLMHNFIAEKLIHCHSGDKKTKGFVTFQFVYSLLSLNKTVLSGSCCTVTFYYI